MVGGPVRLPGCHAEALTDFAHPQRAGLYVRLELCHCLFGPAGSHALRGQACEESNPVLIGAVPHEIDSLLEARTRCLVGADKNAYANRIEFGDERRQAFR